MGDPKANRQTVWSRDHRIIFASAFGIRANRNEVYVELGTEQELNNQMVTLSEAQLVMSLRGMKTLATVLGVLVERLEKEWGEIDLDPGKLAEIEANLHTSVPANESERDA